MHKLAMPLTWSVAIAGALGAAYGGCGSSASCGDGTVESNGVCVVASGGGSSSGSTTGTGGSGGSGGTDTGGSSGTPPKFSGLASISPASTTSVLLAWPAATDDRTKAEGLRYAVYLSESPGGEHFGSPDAIVPNGGTSYLASGLRSGATTYAVVRAIDADGNQDDNTIEKKGVPRADHAPPTFAGAKAATPEPGGKVQVSWSAASDDLSAPGAISYRTWVSDTTPVDTTGAPAAVTLPGETSSTLVLPVPTTTYHFVVHAVDAAGNEEHNAKEVSSKPGHDGEGPTFAGCTAAMAVDAGDIALTWHVADDDSTPHASITYTVYAFDSASQNHDFAHPDKQQPFVGVTGGTIGGLQSDKTYYLVCRASDLAGNEDKNKVEVHAKTPSDTSPPLFNGVVSAALKSGMETTNVELDWDLATDDQTMQSEIAYDVYQSATPGGEALSSPPTTSVVGINHVVVTVNPATTVYWVVRARDLAGNHDANNHEVNATTYVSFSQNLQPIFSSVCTNWHTTTHANGNRPYLDPGISYGDITTYAPNIAIPMDSADSLLWEYTIYIPGDPDPNKSCPYMPFMDCAQKLALPNVALIKSWIDQGVLDN